MYDFLVKLISTSFFIGYTPFIPGTLASLVAGYSIWFLRNHPLFYILATVSIIVLGFSVSSRAEQIFKKRDARQIVIDEVAGMYLGLSFLPITSRIVLCAFLLFRIMDGLKVFPADRLQRLSGGKGIMSDDLVAGIYTNIILQAVFRFALYRIS